MRRRDALKRLTAAAAVPLWWTGGPISAPWQPDRDAQRRASAAIERLRGEGPCRAAVRAERGAVRFFLDGRETLPLMAVSTNLLATAPSYRASGITLLHPLLGLDDGWLGPDRFDWQPILTYLGALLDLVPDARLLPRVHLYPPEWWKDAHPGDLIGYALPVDPAGHRMAPRRIDSGFNWNTIVDTHTASLASEAWRADGAAMLRSFVRAIEASPLRSRVLGYHVAGGLNGEWHYTGSRYLPDVGPAMTRLTGPPPSADARRSTRRGLLRDPALERDVIAYYQRLHACVADTALRFCRVVKAETRGRVLAGLFYGYLLENVMIQEAGHLAPEAVLASPHVDFIAAPYSYLHTTRTKDRPRWESDVYDEAGNWLGRARGVGGDGGLRVMAESIRRHGKLVMSEMDAHTYLEPTQSTEGGNGKETVAGSVRILQRDLAQVVTTGIGGWLFDFGHFDPPYKARRGWYDDAPMIGAIKAWADVGAARSIWDLESIAEVAVLCDARSFAATRHWTADAPWEGFGVSIMDAIDHWFLAAQSRAVHRLGAPVDFLYPADLTARDRGRYRFLIVPNLFLMSAADVDRLAGILAGSGITVLWMYAPGFVGERRLEPAQMARLTGFSFRELSEPGPLLIETPDDVTPGIRAFGVRKAYSPRFAVIPGSGMEVLGRWTGRDEVAFARRRHDGFTSIYCGAAPVPAELLRRLVADAGVSLWSSRPDIVRATRGAAMLIAADDGERTVRFPAPYAPIDLEPAEAGSHDDHAAARDDHAGPHEGHAGPHDDHAGSHDDDAESPESRLPGAGGGETVVGAGFSQHLTSAAPATREVRLTLARGDVRAFVAAPRTHTT
jgi:hypothetical protein